MPAIKYVNKEGKRLKSVTTIIGKQLGWNKDILLGWYSKEFKAGRDPTDKKQKAADTGTLCHHYITCDFFKKEINIEFKEKYDINAILLAERSLDEVKRKLDIQNLTILDSELSLISEQHQYGGTIDTVLGRNNIIILGDIKTSNASEYNPTGIYADHLIQLGAYDNLLKENKLYQPEEYLFIHINKDPKIEDSEIVQIVPCPKEKIELGFEVFKMLLKLDKIQPELKI